MGIKWKVFICGRVLSVFFLTFAAMIRTDFEIMAPVGSRDSLTAALQAGADSVYFGIGRLNMRAHSASAFGIDDLKEIAATCRAHGVKSYLTVNTIIYDEDLPLMREILDAARDAGISAVIASDIAVMTYALLRGKFRSFSFISAAVGFYLYSILPGKAFRVPLELGARILRRALSAAARFISVPLRRVVSAAGRAAAFAARTASKPFVSIAVSAREKRRLKKSKKQNRTDRSRDVTRETVCSVGRRRSF